MYVAFFELYFFLMFELVKSYFYKFILYVFSLEEEGVEIEHRLYKDLIFLGDKF